MNDVQNWLSTLLFVVFLIFNKNWQVAWLYNQNRAKCDTLLIPFHLVIQNNCKIN